jgi:hypothetical protein
LFFRFLAVSLGCSQALEFSYPPTMIWLMGMKMSLMKKPMKPIMANPIKLAVAILTNSEQNLILELK